MNEKSADPQQPEKNEPTPPRRDSDTKYADEVAEQANHQCCISYLCTGMKKTWDHIRSFATYLFRRKRLMVLFTAVLTATTTLYTCFSYRQWHTMGQQLELSERPWVGIIGVNVKGIELRRDSTIVLTGSVLVKNFGPRIALKSITLPVVSTDSRAACREVDRSCDAALTFATGKSHGNWFAEQNPPTLGPALFPDQTFGAELNEGGYLGTKFPVIVYIEGCSAYLDHFRQEHRTKFCFESPFDGKRFTRNWQVCNICNDADQGENDRQQPCNEACFTRAS